MYSQTSVAVADDQPLFVSSIEGVVRRRKELRWAGALDSFDELPEKVAELAPDILVFSVPEGDRSRLNAAWQQMRVLATPPRLVILWSSLDPRRVYRAVEIGADGVLSSRIQPDELGDALVSVASGRPALCCETQTSLVDEVRSRADAERTILTPRELTILQRVADGNRIADVAGELHLSASTVKTHLEHIYRKLGTGDRTTAVVAAMRKGLIH